MKALREIKTPIESLTDRFSIFLEYKDFKIIISLFLYVIEKLKKNKIVYCDSSTPIRWLINKIEQSYRIKLSPKTRFLAIKEIYIDREYTKFADFIPRASDVVVDVGSETGDYVLLCSKFYGVKKVYAFEPNKKSYETMIENISINSCNNVEAFMLGLSSSDGQGQHSFNGDSIFWETGKGTHTISVNKLDTLGLGIVNLLKVDVEGNEIEVLKGSIHTISKFKPRIIVETHSKSLMCGVIKLLEEINYKVKHRGRIVIGENGKEIVNLFFEYTDSI